MVVLARRLIAERIPLVTSAGVVARVWRGGEAQAGLRCLLEYTRVVELTQGVARVLGRMLGVTRGTDPIEAHLVLLAREHAWPVLSSTPAHLLAIDPTLAVERI